MTFDNNNNQSTNETSDLQGDNNGNQSLFADSLFDMNDNDIRQFISDDDFGFSTTEPSAFDRSDDSSNCSNEQIDQNSETPKNKGRGKISLSYPAHQFKKGLMRLLNSNCIKSQVLVLHPIISKYTQLPIMEREEKRTISLYYEHFYCYAPQILETVRRILPLHPEIIRMKKKKVSRA